MHISLLHAEVTMDIAVGSSTTQFENTELKLFFTKFLR